MARRFRNASGPWIRKIRVERGWSQEQLAAKLQLAGLDSFDRVTLAKVESQIRSLYDFELMVVLHVLEVEIEGAILPKNELTADLNDLMRGER